MSIVIYRVVASEDWERTKTQGIVPLGGSDERDGFVHMSTQETMLETANRYFEPKEQPVVLEVEADALGDALKWEPVESRDGVMFPHLYSDGIPLYAIRAVVCLAHSADAGFSCGRRENLKVV